MNKTTNELTYSEIRSKMVVDQCSGKNLGHVCDMVFDADLGKVIGVIAPFGKRGIFSKGQDIFIPLKCITNIGEDVIIVDVGSVSSPCGARQSKNAGAEECHREVPPISASATLSKCNEDPGCDHMCDKCMLFDCRFRWKGKVY